MSSNKGQAHGPSTAEASIVVDLASDGASSRGKKVAAMGVAQNVPSHQNQEEFAAAVAAGVQQALARGELGVSRGTVEDLRKQLDDVSQKLDFRMGEITSRDAVLASVLANGARKMGYHEAANALDPGSIPEDKLAAKFGTVMNRVVEVKHVAYFILATGAAIIIYEGLAFQFDWKRLGLFGEKATALPAATGTAVTKR